MIPIYAYKENNNEYDFHDFVHWFLDNLDKFNDEKAVGYLKIARGWLEKIVKSNTWDDESEKSLAKLNEMIAHLGISI